MAKATVVVEAPGHAVFAGGLEVRAVEGEAALTATISAVVVEVVGTVSGYAWVVCRSHTRLRDTGVSPSSRDTPRRAVSSLRISVSA